MATQKDNPVSIAEDPRQTIVCMNCYEGNVMIGYSYVTTDMALDAGDPKLVGEIYDVIVERCLCCMGDWIACPTCTEQVMGEENEELLHMTMQERYNLDDE